MAEDDSHSKIILAIVGIVVVFALVVILLPKPQETRVGAPVVAACSGKEDWDDTPACAKTPTESSKCKCGDKFKIIYRWIFNNICQNCPKATSALCRQVDLAQMCTNACPTACPGDWTPDSGPTACHDGGLLEPLPSGFASQLICAWGVCECKIPKATTAISDSDEVVSISAGTDDSGTSSGSTETYSSETSPTTQGGY